MSERSQRSTITTVSIRDVVGTFSAALGLEPTDVLHRLREAILHGRTESAEALGLDLGDEVLATRVPQWSRLTRCQQAEARWAVIRERTGD